MIKQLTLICLMTMAFSISVHADIYKCVVNGQVAFSGQPCADNAEKIELNVKQPSQEAIAEQEALTARFQQEGKFSDITRLNQENDELELQIKALEQERQAVLTDLSSKTYSVDAYRVGTREYGLFQKMREVKADYDRKVQQVQQQIDQNELKIDQLYQQ